MSSDNDRLYVAVRVVAAAATAVKASLGTDPKCPAGGVDALAAHATVFVLPPRMGIGRAVGPLWAGDKLPPPPSPSPKVGGGVTASAKWRGGNDW